MTFEKWLLANGDDATALLQSENATQRRHLQAAWRVDPQDEHHLLDNAAQLAALRAARPSAPMVLAPRGDMCDLAGNSEVQAVALALTAGISEGQLLATTPGHILEAARQPHLRGFSLHGLIRDALASAGEHVGGRINEQHVKRVFQMARRDSPEMYAGSPSTISVPGILSNLANKSLLGAYLTAPAPWRSFAAVRSVSDFKTATALRPSMSTNLAELPPGGTIKHATLSSESYSFSLRTYARQLGIDRTQIVNDDLSAFSDVLPAMARSAARTLNDLVATTILANAGSFWSSGNDNYVEGAATNLSLAGLSTAVQKLREMKDAEGNLLDLAPAVLLVPSSLETTARSLLESEQLLRDVSSSDSLPTGNVFRGFAQLAVDPHLSDSGFSGYSDKHWWLFSTPENAACIVAFLDGMERPTLETFDSDVDRLAISFRCYHDFGCALADYRASIKSKGEA